MSHPALSVALKQQDADERVVFYLRADQMAALKAEAVRHSIAHCRRSGDKRGHQVNVSQVIRDALVAAGVIQP